MSLRVDISNVHCGGSNDPPPPDHILKMLGHQGVELLRNKKCSLVGGGVPPGVGFEDSKSIPSPSPALPLPDVFESGCKAPVTALVTCLSDSHHSDNELTI